jgi:hypothetical protein
MSTPEADQLLVETTSRLYPPCSTDYRIQVGRGMTLGDLKQDLRALAEYTAHRMHGDLFEEATPRGNADFVSGLLFAMG